MTKKMPKGLHKIRGVYTDLEPAYFRKYKAEREELRGLIARAMERPERSKRVEKALKRLKEGR